MSAPQHSPAVKALRSLPLIRQRCQAVFDLAKQGQLEYFEYHPENEAAAVDYCAKILERDYGTNFKAIPPHGRWRHFDALSLPRVTTLLSRWGSSTPPVPAIEACRRLIDLFLVSVLLDAGAGPTWAYEEKATGLKIGRSEGLAVASLEMFTEGVFAGEDQENREQCQASALANLTPDLLSISLQVHPESNPMDGLEGRAGLLTRLGHALAKDEHGYFAGPEGTKAELRRPGYLVDYLASHPSTKVNATTGKTEVQVPVLWEALIEGLSPIWPTEGRTVLDGVMMGDVWRCEALAKSIGANEDDERALVPFHKLSQWLCYSLLEPMEQTLGWTFVGGEDQTGLPEYRNGGLLIDTSVLIPRPSLYAASSVPSGPPPEGPIPRLVPSHPAVVEWRALTVIILDRIAQGLRDKWGLDKEALDLKQVLEAATWKGGREIAREKRPETGGVPPIAIDSDGTVF